MEIGSFNRIVRMQESHLPEIFEIAQKNKLSYWSLEDYKSVIFQMDSCCLVAENQDKETMGFLVSRLIITESCAEVYNIAVIDKYKRKGIGGELLSYLTNQCVINKLVQINLEVRESNEAAVRFYLKLDFKQVAVRKNFYTHPTENAFTMIKYLNEQANK